MSTQLVIIESPYAGNVSRNVSYARRALRHSLMLGEAPLASHLLYTQPGVLDDTVDEERALGISAGLRWYLLAERSVAYIDLGFSEGMAQGITFAIDHGKPVCYRLLAQPQAPSPARILELLFQSLPALVPFADNPERTVNTEGLRQGPRAQLRLAKELGALKVFNDGGLGTTYTLTYEGRSVVMALTAL
jgi:hypothetical protein